MAVGPLDLVQKDTVRLISTGRLKESVLLPLTAHHGAFEELASLESVTNGRLQAQDAGMAELDPRELVFGRPGFTFINAAFTHTRPGGNRFNDERRGAWYCAFEVETALAEVGYHLTRELEAINRFETSVDYAELFADFLGRFFDMRDVGDAAEAAISADPHTAYPAGQGLANRLRKDAGFDGIVYPSARRPDGTCLVAFRPDLVQNLRQGGIWRLEWQGQAQPIITQVGR